MKKQILLVLITLSVLLTPISVYAEINISDDAENSEDEILSIGHYDAVTKTETTEIISLSALKTKNEAMKAKLGLSSQSILNGYIPSSCSISIENELNNIAEPKTTPGTYPQTPVNVNNYPYSAVMLLYLGTDTTGNGTINSWSIGSGFLVDSNVMITAAHCFIVRVNGSNQFIDQCRILPKYASSSSPQNATVYYYPKSWSYSTVYMSSRNVEHDWLVATLFSSIGNQNGFLAVRDWASSIQGVTATTAGYPAESSSKRYFQHKSTGPLKSYTTKRMSFIMDIEGGNSGGPVYVSGNQVIGIVTGGGTEANWALRIFEALYTVIENICLAN